MSLLAGFLSVPVLEAGEAHLKGGWLLHVDEDAEIDVEDRWWVGGGGDWYFAEAGLIGFEVSGAYRGDVIGGKVRSRMLPLDVLVSLRWKSPSGGVRPYAAAGIGLASALVWTDVSDPRFSSSFAWERSLGYQFAGGVELGRRFLLEGVFERTYATAASVQVNPIGPEHVFSVAAGVTW